MKSKMVLIWWIFGKETFIHTLIGLLIDPLKGLSGNKPTPTERHLNQEHVVCT